MPDTAPAPSLTAARAFTDWSERAAICASAACLAHCLALPLLLVVVNIPESFHVWVLAFAIPSAAFALGQGWWKHRAWGPLLAGAVRLALLAVGALAVGETPWETPVTVVGSLTLAGAHLVNWRLRRTCGC